jgi:hypothetical protein
MSSPRSRPDREANFKETLQVALSRLPDAALIAPGERKCSPQRHQARRDEGGESTAI